ncbi:spondin domain-containing protein [Shewanella sp. NIFS-20-20]|uniref:spondin domain-containing protein n=1 Tax=Shewanella sp. NIFS-20-20 TaxID=2853806 RepID=UPI001C469DB9|nr:spondin domain-containing protein [Shewanella sp. NIFS-20-20]MBV7316483.1 spondin domain-containing protein [Shewanella sp. NIFS-20-20]
MSAKSLSLLALFGTLAVSAQAAELDITITNLTNGNHFTPILVAGHSSDLALFHAGDMASPALQKMAEGGDISDLEAAVDGAGAEKLVNPASGLLAPSHSTDVVSFDTQDSMYLSVVAMILPTNDAFIGLDSWKIPSEAGTYQVYLNAYDAGTEANDELITGGGMPGVAGIPAAPGGDGGMNGTGLEDMSGNDKVHIHPGVIGDLDPAGGPSDVDSRIHRWLNPVARMTVTVK